MRAYDVQLTVGEMQSIEEQTLHRLIESAAHYDFRIRGQNGEPLESGWTTDFSQLQAVSAESGYPVRVVLPSITEGVVSDIVYHVYVVDDEPMHIDPLPGYTRHVDVGKICISYNDLYVSQSEVQIWLEQNVASSKIVEQLDYQVSVTETQMGIEVQAWADSLAAIPGEYPVTLDFLIDGQRVPAQAQLTVTPQSMHRVTVRYIDQASGQQLAECWELKVAHGAAYDVSEQIGKEIGGYRRVKVEGEPSGLLTEDSEVTVYYQKKSNAPNTRYYKVTVRYIDRMSGKALIEPYISEGIREGRDYDVRTQTEKEIAHWTRTEVEGEPIGKATGNLTLTVYYEPIEPQSPSEEDEPVPPEETGSDNAGPDNAVESETSPSVLGDVPMQGGTAQQTSNTVQAGRVNSKPLQPRTIEETATKAVIEIPEATETAAARPREIIDPSKPLKKQAVMIEEQPNASNTSQAESVLLMCGTAATALMGGGIVSDLRVLRWYCEKKKRVMHL